MGKYTRPAVMAVAVLLSFCTGARSATLSLVGRGILPDVGDQPVGVPGENITVSVALNSDDFLYLPMSNSSVHYFAPIRAIPVTVIGSLTGQYPNVSPIARFLAIELNSSSTGGDLIELDVAASSSGTSLFSLSTQGLSGFDGDLTPYNPTQLFELFVDAMEDGQLWQRSSSSAVFAGPDNGLVFLGELDWQLMSTVLGDFDADGDVDGHDFLRWQRDPSVGSLADWKAGYATAVSKAIVVPELTSLALATIGTLLTVGRRVLFR